jgi:hypothetical protein
MHLFGSQAIQWKIDGSLDVHALELARHANVDQYAVPMALEPFPKNLGTNCLKSRFDTQFVTPFRIRLRLLASFFMNRKPTLRLTVTDSTSLHPLQWAGAMRNPWGKK